MGRVEDTLDTGQIDGDRATLAKRSGASSEPADTVVATEWTRLRLLDAATVVTAVALSLLFARPLLEEWSLANYWRAYGVTDYFTLAKHYPLRPLQAVPSALAWVIGHGSIAGYALAFAAVLAAKYAAMRWAVGRFLTPSATWLAATMALVLIPWIAVWRMRYAGVGLAAALLFVVLGALLRNGDRLSARWTALAVVATGLMLATYQGPAVCSLALPFVVLAGLAGDATSSPRPGWLRRGAVAIAPVAGGWILYGIYGTLAVTLNGSAGYEGTLADSNPHLYSARQVVHDVARLYQTAYTHTPWTLPLLLGLLLAVAGPAISEVADRSARLRWTIGLGVAVGLLPLLGFAYAALPALLFDPDRVTFAVGAGFTLIAVTALLRFAPPGTERPALVAVVVPAVVGALLVWLLILGNENRRNFQIEDSVVTQTARLVARTHASTVVLADRTGTLGDIYLLYPPVFREALSAHGARVTRAVLCTPMGIDRYTPVARQQQMPTTERCEALAPIAPAPLRLEAVAAPGKGVRVLRAP